MKRFRLRFILLSIVVLVPLAFLVYRAVRSAEVEAQMQHQAIAERVFDEMERGLSQVLETEERRPVEAFLAAGDPSFPFVTGHFEIEPNGGIEVAAAPAPSVRDTARRVMGRESKSKSSADLEATLSSYWRDSAASKQEARAPTSQLPGTTLAFGGRKRANVASDQLSAKPAGEGEEVSTLQALRSLNKGAAEREDRPAAKEEAFGRDKAVAAGAPVEADKGLGDESAPPSRQQMIARSVIEATPMSGRLMDPQQLLLVRTVVRAAQAYRQGVVIDLNALGRWLHDSSLGSNGLAAQASVSFSTDGFPYPEGDELAGTSGIYIYQHRFAEPFDDLIARMALTPLPGGNLTYIYALSALLLAAATFGLAAIYRMVAVVVAFAERRSNFVAAVSHELKTPLTAIRMYGEMLRDGIVPSEAKRGEYYRHITAEAERLSRLIDNVLEFSRLEKGHRSVNLVSASIVPAVREAADLLRPHVESRGFRLIVECDERVPPVRFERDALVQVLCNLGDNAVKYAADSLQREIELRCRQDNGTVLLTVRDHGPGVAQRHLGKIFEPFYRGENELTRRTKGTGLGLALVRGLCERMGAEVNGRNAAGGGFEVAIVLFP